jgi:uncharacterized membrane protein YdfJ with MMPL/SSD domain
MERLARRYVTAAKRRPFTWLAVYLVLAVLGVWAGLTLTINMDLKTLLPQNTPSVRALEASQERRGSNDLFTIAVESPDPYANVAFIQALDERIRQWPEVRWVQIDHPLPRPCPAVLPVERLETLRDACVSRCARAAGRQSRLRRALRRLHRT